MRNPKKKLFMKVSSNIISDGITYMVCNKSIAQISQISHVRTKLWPGYGGNLIRREICASSVGRVLPVRFWAKFSDLSLKSSEFARLNQTPKSLSSEKKFAHTRYCLCLMFLCFGSNLIVCHANICGFQISSVFWGVVYESLPSLGG